MRKVGWEDCEADGMWALPPKGNGTRVRREPLSCEALRAWFPNLEILELVGVGGMGAVYKARQPRLGRTVALKILNGSSGHRPDFALRFEREAQVMARLNHPGIVSVYDFGEVDRASAGLEPLYYLLMEHVDGADLGRLIASVDLTFGQAMEFARQICDALQYAHDQGVTHRDIKPANLLVDRNGRLKIADFGLAKLLRSDDALAAGLTLSGVVMGTPRYMAPEQWESPDAVDGRTDLYSLGAVIHELLAKERELGARPPSSITGRSHRRIVAIVAKAMEREPTRRFQTATELGEALGRAVGGRPGSRKGRGLLRWVAAAGMLALAAAAAGLLARFGVPGWADRRGDSPVASGDTITPGLYGATRDQPFVNSLGMKFVPVPGTDVLFCIHETRWKDYEAYAKENPGINGEWRNQTADTYKGDYTVTERAEDHPVGAVNREDAKAFCEWLGRKEGKSYRLPTDEEWSLAVGLGGKELRMPGDTPESLGRKIIPEFPWGTAWPPPTGAGNYSDRSRKAKAPGSGDGYLEEYDDGFPTTAPVMSFAPNRFGLYDMGGNVRELVEDRFSAAQDLSVYRGATWAFSQESGLRSMARSADNPMTRRPTFGFRVVLAASAQAAPPSAEPATPHPAAGGSGSQPSPAAKDRPFENSLGMKFVPVPGADVLFCVHETRYKDYAAYAAENPGIDGMWKNQTIGGYEITDRAGEHPVILVSWEDSAAFCEWLGRKERRSYRLPTDREWSIAVGIGDLETRDADATPASVSGPEGIFPWGTQWPPPAGAGNYGDKSRKARSLGAGHMEGYDDSFLRTAPVMSFPPNPFGLHDLGGNVGEWCEDWWDGVGAGRTVRGSSFNSSSQAELSSSRRTPIPPWERRYGVGFRVVLEVAGKTPDSRQAQPEGDYSPAEPPVPSEGADLEKRL